jgi:hypothetical protein
VPVDSIKNMIARTTMLDIFMNSPGFPHSGLQVAQDCHGILFAGKLNRNVEPAFARHVAFAENVTLPIQFNSSRVFGLIM